MGMSLILITSCAISGHFFLPVEKNMPKIRKITKDEMKQLNELVRENVPLYDKSSSNYSNVPFISNIWESISNKMPLFVLFI